MAECNLLKINEIVSDKISTHLAESGRLDHIIYGLRQGGILSNLEYEELLNLESTELFRCKRLLNIIKQIENSSNAFVITLLKEGFINLANMVDPDYVASICGRDSSSDFRDSLVELPHVRQPYLHSNYPTEDNRLAIPPECYNSESDDEPLKINVRYPTLPPICKPDVYKNSTEPRGLVYIGNYNEFNDKKLNPPRRGSEVDAKNLVELFTQMGYLVELHENLNHRDTLTSLRAFQSNKRLNEVDCCVIIMMSHGYDDKSFYTSDDMKLEGRKVIRMFNNDECPSMRGKPKIIIFQHCRGTAADMGVPEQPVLVYNEASAEVDVDGVSQGFVQLNRDPEFFDTYIVYSSIEGFVSYRNPERGSWLIDAICMEFMEHAWEYDVIRLMNLATLRINTKSSNGRKQTPCYLCEGFVKTFFFNPIKLDMCALNMNSLSRALSYSCSTSSMTSLVTQGNQTPEYLRKRIGSSSRCSTPDSVYELSYSNSNGNIAGHLLAKSSPRSRNWSGASNNSDMNDDQAFGSNVSLKINREVYSPHQTVMGREGRFRRASVPSLRNSRELYSNAFSASNINPSPQEHQYMESGYDVVDTLPPVPQADDISPHSIQNAEEYNSLYYDFGVKNNVEKFSSECETVFRGTAEDYAEWCQARKYDSEDKGGTNLKRQISFPSETETIRHLNQVKKYLRVKDLDQFSDQIEVMEKIVMKEKNKGKRRKGVAGSQE